jgi:hypothetical protein
MAFVTTLSLFVGGVAEAGFDDEAPELLFEEPLLALPQATVTANIENPSPATYRSLH